MFDKARLIMMRPKWTVSWKGGHEEDCAVVYICGIGYLRHVQCCDDLSAVRLWCLASPCISSKHILTIDRKCMAVYFALQLTQDLKLV